MFEQFPLSLVDEFVYEGVRGYRGTSMRRHEWIPWCWAQAASGYFHEAATYRSVDTLLGCNSVWSRSHTRVYGGCSNRTPNQQQLRAGKTGNADYSTLFVHLAFVTGCPSSKLLMQKPYSNHAPLSRSLEVLITLGCRRPSRVLHVQQASRCGPLLQCHVTVVALKHRCHFGEYRRSCQGIGVMSPLFPTPVSISKVFKAAVPFERYMDTRYTYMGHIHPYLFSLRIMALCNQSSRSIYAKRVLFLFS